MGDYLEKKKKEEKDILMSIYRKGAVIAGEGFKAMIFLINEYNRLVDVGKSVNEEYRKSLDKRKHKIVKDLDRLECSIITYFDNIFSVIDIQNAYAATSGRYVSMDKTSPKFSFNTCVYYVYSNERFPDLWWRNTKKFPPDKMLLPGQVFSGSHYFSNSWTKHNTELPNQTGKAAVILDSCNEILRCISNMSILVPRINNEKIDIAIFDLDNLVKSYDMLERWIEKEEDYKKHKPPIKEMQDRSRPFLELKFRIDGSKMGVNYGIYMKGVRL